MKKQFLKFSFTLTAALLAATALFISACMNTDNAATAQGGDSQTGQIQLVPMKGLSKVTASAHVTDTCTTYTFDLDSIRASEEFYFLLQNTGTHDVRNITITSSNPAFTFSPSKIAVLSPIKDANVQQLVKLSVVHGVRLDGIGSAPLLPQGVNVADVGISGNTVNGHNDAISLSVNTHLTVFAKVLNFALYDDSTLLDDLHPASGFAGGTAVPEYTPQFPVTGTPRIVNTGNVPIMVKNFSANLITRAEFFTDSTIVPPGGQCVPISQGAGNNILGHSEHYGSTVIVDIQGGTITSPTINKPHEDGTMSVRFGNY